MEDTEKSGVIIEEPESFLYGYLSKVRCRGGRCDLPAPEGSEVWFSFVGIFVGMGLLCLLGIYYNLWLLIPSFSASAVMLYTTPDASMAQPRSVFLGHLIAAAAGLASFHLIGNGWWAIALAVVVSTLLMSVTRSLHPPAGGTAFLVNYCGYGFGAAMSSVFLSSLVLILIAVVVNNLASNRKYPSYWI
ncbi:MAG: HPP family protein [Firmicutes bacterium]|nr:HPP family protein [Bacillota bacterium]